ncbi:aldehyde dehydrogenase family protein [Glaciihabitans sp. UYNi722]|uniref:aldehyde dehydrogenase family protein n=1 Tax=Glaciihabitans sp. UYNi722 TaxID=3156344 RepID=UPI003393D86F
MIIASEGPTHPMRFGRQLHSAANGHLLPVINPSTEQEIGSVPAGGAADVASAVERAEEGGRSWTALSWRARADLLGELAVRLADSAEELARLDTTDSGNPISGMRYDAMRAGEELRYFAGLGGEAKGDSIPWTADQFGLTFREPYGVVGRITAFNHPLLYTVGKSAAPLIVGNSVILKPSEHTSLSSLRFAEIAADLLPDGVLNVVTGTGTEAGAALVEHPRVHRLAFTGGVPTGRAILRAAAEGIKHVSLELGGKNPMIVFPDVDVDAAVRAAVTGMNLRRSSGQSCQSTSRILVHESIAGKFIEALVALVETLRVGDPHRDDVEMGPISFATHYERVMNYIEIGKSEGATLATGGTRPAGLDVGYFIAPTVFTDVDPQMRIANEEIFGPVMSVLTWNDYDEMLQLANGVEYGLTANVWTRDFTAAHRTAQRLEAGMVWINGETSRPAGVPFGGFKHSGIGKEGGLSEVLGYTREKSVIVNLV